MAPCEGEIRFGGFFTGKYFDFVCQEGESIDVETPEGALRVESSDDKSGFTLINKGIREREIVEISTYKSKDMNGTCVYSREHKSWGSLSLDAQNRKIIEIRGNGFKIKARKTGYGL